MIKEVKVFQTEDGKKFNEKGDAVAHEFALQLRGVIQSHTRAMSFSPLECAAIIAEEQDKIFTLLTKFRKEIKKYKA